MGQGKKSVPDRQLVEMVLEALNDYFRIELGLVVIRKAGVPEFWKYLGPYDRLAFAYVVGRMYERHESNMYKYQRTTIPQNPREMVSECSAKLIIHARENRKDNYVVESGRYEGKGLLMVLEEEIREYFRKLPDEIIYSISNFDGQSKEATLNQIMGFVFLASAYEKHPCFVRNENHGKPKTKVEPKGVARQLPLGL